ncbi:MAG: hypothetical protein OEV81_09155 [Betaproteobacteria bacterium]|nr:hypothetical protein [Betaproteobacteria bacterium]MDH5351012.1 hypothetical protein [Betaproteobacteria bacterium]
MVPSDLVIDKLWLGLGEGNQLRVTHVPSGITVLGKPIRGDDPDRFAREKDRLLVELKRKLEESGHDAEAI